MTTMAGAYSELDELRARVVELTEMNAALIGDNGALRMQQHDLVRARDVACADARMLRAELETAKNELRTARVRSSRRGW